MLLCSKENKHQIRQKRNFVMRKQRYALKQRNTTALSGNKFHDDLVWKTEFRRILRGSQKCGILCARRSWKCARWKCAQCTYKVCTRRAFVISTRRDVVLPSSSRAYRNAGCSTTLLCAREEVKTKEVRVCLQIGTEFAFVYLCLYYVREFIKNLIVCSHHLHLYYSYTIK